MSVSGWPWRRRTRAHGALALFLFLSACAGGAGLTPSAPPGPEAAAPTAGPAAPAPAPAPTRPADAALTTEQLNTECWMRADADRRLPDIDARLAYVKRCVAERGPRR
jgi:hypothetical protein